MKRLMLPLVLLAAATSFSTDVLGQAQQVQVPNPFKSVEYLLLGDATRGAGEPMIAVDPTNPKNIIAVAMGTLGELPPPPPGKNPGQASIPRSTINWLAVTHDGGKTWKVGEQPILKDTFTRCPDAIADVTKDGTFIAGCEPRETIGPAWGLSAMQMSDDRGDTWGQIIEIIPQWDRERFAPGLKPVFQGASPYDRPFTFIDDSTGVIYGVAKGGQTTIDGPSRQQSYVTAMIPGTRKFGMIYSWDSPEYPQIYRGGSSAQHGVFWATYTASKAPAAAGATCPCPMLGMSRDHGKTFTYRVLKNLQPVLPAPATQRVRGARPTVPATATTHLQDISADPTKAGRIALLTLHGGPNARLQVAMSDDSGATWSPLVLGGQTPGVVLYEKTAFEYSREGVLGLMWRGVYADGSYDIWASISKDGGKTFSKPLQVSHAKSPGTAPEKDDGNDDVIDFMMDKENMHLIWGDFRSGFLGSWYGRVALSAFEF